LVSPVTSDRQKIQKSTRTIRKCEKVRKGVEPTGFNKEVGKAQWAMKEMFLTGKLLKSGTVPKNQIVFTLKRPPLERQFLD
jgi:hypothetical protein